MGLIQTVRHDLFPGRGPADADPVASVEYSAESLKRWAPKMSGYDLPDDKRALFFDQVVVSKNRLGCLLSVFLDTEPLMLWDATSVMYALPCLGLFSKTCKAYLMGFSQEPDNTPVEVFVDSSTRLFELACGGLREP